MTNKLIRLYTTESGEEPFINWLESIKDKTTRNRITARIERLEDGNLGDYKSIGFGVCELRLHFGTGYRIYLAMDGNTVVVLLVGGDKKTQNKDIRKAIEYWNDYKERKK